MDYLAAGTSYHQRAVRRFRDRDRVRVELVPEPFNRFDGWAVALDVLGDRVGYLPAGAAKIWHDIVKACNRAGLAVVVDGVFRRDSWVSDDHRYASDAALKINTGRLPDIMDLATACGLKDQHDAVLASIEPSLQEQMIEDSWDGLNSRLVSELRRRKADAPALTWLGPGDRRPDECVPFWHLCFLRQEVIDRRQRAAMLGVVKRLLRREVKRRAAAQRTAERQQSAREQANRRLELSIEALRLQGEGRTHAEIAAVLGVPPAAVPGLLSHGRKAAPEKAVDWHAREQMQRVDRAREALRLQRSGMSRAEVATAVGCSAEAVKDLLADARFYEAPDANPDRLALARSCQVLRDSGLPKADVLVALGASRAGGERAYRDASVLSVLGLARVLAVASDAPEVERELLAR
jgi:predicted transcriptional regulator